MNQKTPECLVPAIRQFRHNNDNSPSITHPEQGFVVAYDVKATESAVTLLEVEIERLKALCREYAEEAGTDIGMWGSYTDDYYQEELGLDADLAKWKARAGK